MYYYNPYTRAYHFYPYERPPYSTGNQLQKFVGFFVDIELQNGKMHCNVRLDSVIDPSGTGEPSMTEVQITRFVNGIPQSLPLTAADILTIDQAGRLCTSGPSTNGSTTGPKPPWCNFFPPGTPGC